MLCELMGKKMPEEKSILLYQNLLGTAVLLIYACASLEFLLGKAILMSVLL